MMRRCSVVPAPLNLLAALALMVAGCEEEVITPELPTPEAWTPPTFEGDGLPPSESTEHQSFDGAAGTPSPGEGEGEEGPGLSLSIYDGVFAWSYNALEGYTAELILLDRSQSCHGVFGALDSFTADGIYFSLRTGEREEGVSPPWAGLYRLCQAKAPCVDGYARIAGDYQPLGDRAFLEIVSYDDHYLTTNWKTSVSSGQALTFYNCGPMGNWNY